MFSSKNRRAKGVDLDPTSLNLITLIIIAIVFILIATLVYFIVAGPTLDLDGNDNDTPVSSLGDYPYKQDISISIPDYADDVAVIASNKNGTDGIYSEFAALIDVTDNKIIASKKATQDIYPASMTKVMTLIVVVENLKTEEAMDERLTISQKVVDKMITEGSSGFGFKAGEKLSVKDLLHALILKSDGIASLTLAEYIAGSESAFVDMMNAKASAIGMTDTNFTNSTGLHETYLISSCKDIAIMMSYAMNNTFCAEILSAKSHVLPDDFRDDTYTLYHATLVTKFDAIKPKTSTVTVKAAKSGWTGSDSGYCLVTFAVGNNGHKYVLVTAKANKSEESIADMAYIYNNYVK